MSDLGGLLPTSVDVDTDLDEFQQEKIESDIVTLSKRKHQLIIGGSTLIGALLTFLILFSTGNSGIDNVTSNSKNALAGEVALTQDQLFKLVKESQLVAYWVGPDQGAMYGLTITADNQVFIKYLPEGNGLGDLLPNYRVVATYPESAAYDITRAAGTQANAISFINADGAAIYYSKDRATNIYIAYTGIPYEIEVFDPDPATALDFATAPGAVVQIQ